MIDLKRQSQGQAPTLPDVISASGDFGVDVRAPPHCRAETTADTAPTAADRARAHSTPNAHATTEQPAFRASRNAPLITNRRRRGRQIGVERS